MTTPALLDIAPLLEEIPGEHRPAGVSVQFTLTPKLDELRREVVPEEGSSEEPKHADWAGIVQLTEKALREESKELLLASRLTEALVQQHAPTGKGFAALRDGLRLLRSLVERCWDFLLPAVSESDHLEVRAAAFTWLNNLDRKVHFPITLRMLPLLEGKGTSISYHDWKESSKPQPGQPTSADIEAILAVANPERCRQVAADASEALSELDGLITTLDTKMEKKSPNLLELRDAVKQCEGLAQDFAARRPKSAPIGDTSKGSDATANAGGGAAALSTRAEVYEQLRRASVTLRTLEPHSPVPYLIDRAIVLGKLPFPEMIREFISDINALKDLNRELGLKDGAASPEATQS